MHELFFGASAFARNGLAQGKKQRSKSIAKGSATAISLKLNDRFGTARKKGDGCLSSNRKPLLEKIIAMTAIPAGARFRLGHGFSPGL